MGIIQREGVTQQRLSGDPRHCTDLQGASMQIAGHGLHEPSHQGARPGPAAAVRSTTSPPRTITSASNDSPSGWPWESWRS